MGELQLSEPVVLILAVLTWRKRQEDLRCSKPVAEMVYAVNNATIARFTKDGENLFLLNGKFADPEKKSFNGSRGWLSNLRLNNQPISMRNLLNTIMVQQMQHHYAVAPGD